MRYGAAVGVGLYLIGLPSALLWGILATTLRFIPYLGPWIAAALPPAAVIHARTLCRRLRGRFPAANLVVGLWHAQHNLDKAKERIGCGADVHVVATLADAQSRIRLLLQPLSLAGEEQTQSNIGPGTERAESFAEETV